MAEPFDDFPEMAGADRQATRAITLLEQAAADVRRADSTEHGWAARAAMLRGAASLAMTAATQLAVTSGWNAAADAANRAGMLDGGELPTDPQATEGS